MRSTLKISGGISTIFALWTLERILKLGKNCIHICYKYKNSKGVMQPRPSADLLNEINTIEPSWKPPDAKTPGVKPK